MATDNKKQTAKKSLIRAPRSMEELLKSGPVIPNIQSGQVVDARIISIGKRDMLFDIGWKTNAILVQSETKEIGTFKTYLKENQKIPVKIITLEAKGGFPVVSLQQFFEQGKWDILKVNFEKEEPVEVEVLNKGKGGLFIQVMGIRGVIPKIQLTREFLQEPEKLTGKKIKVKILEVDREKNRLVVSQKAAALNLTQSKLQKMFDEIKENETYTCKVIGFSDFGIFCEVNGIEGLVHISEISWKKVTDPRQYAKEGQEIQAMVLKKNVQDYKLTLSIKRLENDPWQEIESKYPNDVEFKGKVVRKEAYGYFVRLEPGIEGLIHSSKIGPETTLEIDKDVMVYVERIDKKNRKMSLVPAVSTGKPLMYR